MRTPTCSEVATAAAALDPDAFDRLADLATARPSTRDELEYVEREARGIARSLAGDLDLPWQGVVEAAAWSVLGEDVAA